MILTTLIQRFLAGAACLTVSGMLMGAETPVLKEGDLAAFKLTGSSDAVKGSVVAVSGPSFDKAWRIEVTRKPEHPYHLQLGARNSVALKKGDVLVIRCQARTVASSDETGEGRVSLVFEKASQPHTKSMDASVPVGREWRLMQEGFICAENYAAGEAHFTFMLGHYAQTLELAAIQLVNLGTGAKVPAAIGTSNNYAGRAPDAPWRKAAEARIEQIRKSELQVKVTDQAGRPVSGARVEATMTRHEFGFGSAVVARFIMDNQSPDAQKYRETILKLYNKVVFENDLKWHGWENAANRDSTFKALQWLETNGIAVRGHCLVWPSWKNTPRSLAQLKNDLPALSKTINNHITDEVSALRGRIVEWDVINEPYNNHDVMDLLGNQVMVDWFKLAHQCDPKPRLYLNDYSILSAGGKDFAHQDHFEKTLRFLKDNGAPITGLGVQSHFGRQVTSPELMLKILDRFAALGLDIQGTEHDVDTNDEELQADFTRDYLTVMFSHPSVVGVLTWGFWETRHWKPYGAYFRKDWSVKPAGQVWMDLTLKKWWTREHGITGNNGTFSCRAFHGSYDIKVNAGGKSKTVKVQLARGDKPVAIALD